MVRLDASNMPAAGAWGCGLPCLDGAIASARSAPKSAWDPWAIAPGSLGDVAMGRRVAVIIIVLLLGVSAVAVWAVDSDSEALDDLLVDLDLKDANEDAVTGSGFIEAEQVTVAGELGGRVGVIAVDVGDEVAAGDVLVELDSEPIAARIRQAEAAFDAAAARLDRVREGARPEEVRQAEAAVAQANAARDGAEAAWQDAQAVLRSPQELDIQVDAAQTAVNLAEEQVRVSEAGLRAAEAGKDEAKALLNAASAGAGSGLASAADVSQARVQFQQAEDLWLQARMAVEASEVELEGARLKLEHLRVMRDNPLVLTAQVDAARARYDVARAAADGAASQLELVLAGAPADQVRLAEAAVRQAGARLATLRVQQDKMKLRAPMDGTVIELAGEPGENAVPGAALLRLGQLDPVELTIFVAEKEVGDVDIGQTVEVTVDAFEDETFEGEVVSIATEPEFTPKNVQTREDRANLVFAVRIRLPNEDRSLKPGMPADAVLVVGQEKK